MPLRLKLLRAYMAFARLKRGITLGVRGAVFDEAGRVFLVRHSYLPGWYLPGGGVEPGEDVAAAVRRELLEEGGISLAAEPELFGLYLNRAVSPRDHVALFLCRTWRRDPAAASKGLEIVEGAFFALDALPGGTTPGTLRRLAEIAGSAPRAAEW